jgi:MFS family permease
MRGPHLRLFLIVGGITALAPAGMDIYLPGLPGLSDDLGASPSAAQLTVSAYLVGLLTGQLVAGPMSDVLGRRRPLLAGLIGFTLASLACSGAPDIYVLIALRFLQGTSGGVGMSVGRAVVRDLYEGPAAAPVLFVLLPGVGPLVANLPLTLFVCSAPFIQANAMALALTEYPHAAGAAASLLGVFQFALGAAVAPLVGIGSRSNASAMAAVLLTCTCAAVLTLVLRRSGSERIEDRAQVVAGPAGGL